MSVPNDFTPRVQCVPGPEWDHGDRAWCRVSCMGVEGVAVLVLVGGSVLAAVQPQQAQGERQ